METRQPRHRRRGPAAPKKPAPNAFTLSQQTGHRPRTRFLSADQLDALKRRSFDLLADYGVVVIHPHAKQALTRAGARPGSDADRLKLPRELVALAISQTPKSLRLCGKTPEFDLDLPRSDGSFVMRTGTGGHGYVDPKDAVYRDLDLRAARDIAAIASGLDQVGFIAHPFVAGVPEVTADIHSYGEIASHTNKHCWLQPYGKDNVEYLLRIAAVAAGGEAELRARPSTSVITCSFSPLEFKFMDSEIIVQAGRLGMPIHACSLPSAGGTAPLSVAGLVLMAAAEVLAMVTLAHVLAPGTPVIATPLMFTLDMKTGSALQSCPESLHAAGMAVQLMKEGFGLVTHSYGSGSDTPDADHQSMSERALLGQTVALAGADILGGIGQLECATVFSPVQAVLDNEIGAMIRRATDPVDTGADCLNWEEVQKVRAGGHFLDSAHTLSLCRDQHQPDVFLREGRDDYEKTGRRAAFDVARERALALIGAAPMEGVLSADQRREITGITQAADLRIVEENAKGGAVKVI